MGLMDDAMATDDAFAFSADGPFAEQVIYKPRVPSVSNPVRTIWAEVNRRPPATPGELSQGLTPRMTIAVRNDPTAGATSTGISAQALDIGGDSINVAIRKGGTLNDNRQAEDIMLNEPDQSDAGRLVFRIGR